MQIVCVNTSSEAPGFLNSTGGGGWELAGIQVWLRQQGKGRRKGAKADLVFASNNSNLVDYLIVETEDSFAPNKVRKGKRQTAAYARLLRKASRQKVP